MRGIGAVAPAAYMLLIEGQQTLSTNNPFNQKG
jgi:hypothetical protein